MSQRTIQVGYDDEGEPLSWPAVWEICHRCRGEGTHVNPAIDGNGIPADEFAEWDEDDRQMYLTGGYDITCTECNGEGKALNIDEMNLSPELITLLDQTRRDIWESQAVDRSEARAFGYDR